MTQHEHETQYEHFHWAIIQWTHTLVMKPMLLAARQQIAPYAPRVEHHVVLSVCGRGKESNATACDDMLAKAHPLTENVTCVWPRGIIDELRAFRHEQRLGKIGKYSWCWNGCDGPILSWYARVGQALKHLQFFWFLEWDVVWTGNIVSVLDAYHPDATANVSYDAQVDVFSPLRRRQQPQPHEMPGAAHPPDLICPNPGWAPLRWPHRHVRDRVLVPWNFTFKCVTEISRSSRRLLDRMLLFSQSESGAMFCEMRAPSVCAMQPWCRMRSLFDTPEHTRLFYTSHCAYNDTKRKCSQRSAAIIQARRKVSAADSGDARAVAAELASARERWVLSYLHDGGVKDAELASHATDDMLFHAYKWENVSFVLQRAWLGAAGNDTIT